MQLFGHLASEPLAAVRSRAAAVLVPSRFPETFGYVVAEAQLEGRVVVASTIGALTELVEHEATGLLVPPGDPRALADATRRALEDPAAAAWGEAARARATSLFTPAAHARGLAAVYEESLAATDG
jgi:glycosyltransferase involved in cell wall biosynthesis